jgi:hypothetical protein
MVEVCRLCDRPVEDVERALCEYHARAYRSLREGYGRWREAYGDLTYPEYLRRLIELPEAGRWVKEVARLELEGVAEDA